MPDIHVSPDAAIARQQFLGERDRILHNKKLSQAAKDWQVRRLEQTFARAYSAHKHSWPVRLLLVLILFPVSIIRALYDMEDILRYGIYPEQQVDHEEDDQRHVDKSAEVHLVGNLDRAEDDAVAKNEESMSSPSARPSQ